MGGDTSPQKKRRDNMECLMDYNNNNNNNNNNELYSILQDIGK